MTDESSFFDTMKQYAPRILTAVPYARAMGFEMVDIQPGRAIARAPWREDLVGDPATGVIHGGVITALLDNICGVAVVAALKTFKSTATLDLRIDYMRAADPGEAIIAEAECYHVTRSVAFVRGTAYHDTKDRLIANATAAFMLNDPIRWGQQGGAREA
jgi:uncharacterized protein (TIGR00369 family)